MAIVSNDKSKVNHIYRNGTKLEADFFCTQDFSEELTALDKNEKNLNF
jgi:hypothetical protein